jgi:predicted transcriptional regulator of viral defense system
MKNAQEMKNASSVLLKRISEEVLFKKILFLLDLLSAEIRHVTMVTRSGAVTVRPVIITLSSDRRLSFVLAG